MNISGANACERTAGAQVILATGRKAGAKAKGGLKWSRARIEEDDGDDDNSCYTLIKAEYIDHDELDEDSDDSDSSYNGSATEAESDSDAPLHQRSKLRLRSQKLANVGELTQIAFVPN